MSDNLMNTDLSLLRSVQDFLRAQLEQQQPDALLTRAWDEFYRIYSDLIVRFVAARGLRGADADDCVQAVWMDVALRLAEFERPPDRPGLRAWLYTVVRSKAGDVFRRYERRAASLDQARAAGAEPASTRDDPAEHVEAQWRRALLDTLLDDLRREVSQTNVRLLELRLIEGRSVGEAAAELGLTSEQVWYRQHRLLKKLRARVTLYTGAAFGPQDDEWPEALFAGEG